MARQRTTDDLTPGTPAGDAYLVKQARKRKTLGYVGFTRKGRGSDTTSQYGSKIQKAAGKRGGRTSR